MLSNTKNDHGHDATDELNAAVLRLYQDEKPPVNSINKLFDDVALLKDGAGLARRLLNVLKDMGLSSGLLIDDGQREQYFSDDPSLASVKEEKLLLLAKAQHAGVGQTQDKLFECDDGIVLVYGRISILIRDYDINTIPYDIALINSTLKGLDRLASSAGVEVCRMCNPNLRRIKKSLCYSRKCASCIGQ
jgi:hypothetical protein